MVASGNSEGHEPQALATITQGSLTQGLEARLNPGISVEEMRVGKFVVVRGHRNRFFGLLTDVALGSTSPQISIDPPQPHQTFLSDVLAGTSTFGTVSLVPMLMIVESTASDGVELLPVKTIPAHFSQVFEAVDGDFHAVFGSESDRIHKNFAIGQPVDMSVPVCINLDRFVERSNGIFGKSGTGKSFLTRLLLSGVIRRQAAVNLIFDMHSEYGWEAATEGHSTNTVKGLKQLFPSQVQIYTLDPESTQRRGVRDALELFISYGQIEVEDLALLRDEINISEASLENAVILRNEFGRDWISRLMSMSNSDIQEFCEQRMGHKASMMALQRKLTRLEDLPYLRPVVPHNYINRILESLEAGKHVVIEFGAQANMLSYMLASNIITRRIHQAYVLKAERYLHSKNPADKPRQLMIVIEEAHRFLAPQTVKQTIYGTIAREMRKYFVTLLVIDQRPSGIDSEVMSQVGTRITALLNDDKDIDAVFTGVSGSQNLRTILAKLDSKQQVMILGHSVPMPVVVRTRPYDERFYAEMGEMDWSNIMTCCFESNLARIVR
ncbi:MAG: DUF87 domain-containing protein, partial [Cyanobacteria bacterium J06555_12]